MIKDAVIHMPSEQPLRADLPEMPAAGDVSLVCTNLRTMDGKRPAFADRSDSVFVFPYERIRFVEIPTVARLPPGGRVPADEPAEPASDGPSAEEEAGLEAEFLRRVREA